MRRSHRGWEDQFRAYVLENRGRLLRTAGLLVSGNAHQAEDLVQTVLTRMYVSWPRIRQDSRDAYVRKMLVNAHLDERRRPSARRARHYAEVPDVPVDDLEPSELEAAVFRALAQLPPRMRAAVILRHLHDASVAETADVLGRHHGPTRIREARQWARQGPGRHRAATSAPARRT